MVGYPQKRHIARLVSQDSGAAVVEFAIIIIVLLVIIGGILDFGHAWYMRQVITNASREGARYGITYRTDTNGSRIPPSAISPSIESHILNNYLANTIMPSNANPTVTCGGTGYSTGDKGGPLEVKVTAIKKWLLLPLLLPGLIESEKTLQATTVMECE